MENAGIKHESEPFRRGVFEIPGEPAIIINGVPDEPKTDGAIAVNNTESHGSVGCGEWLEGREVRKLFLGRNYSGKVMNFDQKNGWYRVEYEDGDFEDLEWHELEQVLLPLDITIPLKSLALGIVGSRQLPTKDYGQTQTRKTKSKISREERLAVEAGGQDSVIAQSEIGESREKTV